MSTLKEDNELIIKATRWGIRVSEQVIRAGGSPESVLAGLPDAMIATMVRNNMEIVCVAR